MLRFWLAVTTFVVGLVLSAIGLVNQLDNRPVESIVATAELKTPTTYVVIPNKILSAYPGKVSVEASNAGPVFLATGRESDIVGWVGDSQYVELKMMVNVEQEKIIIGEVERSGQGELSNPAGSDMWRIEVAGNLKEKISVPEGSEIGVLVSASGVDLAPRVVKITWDLGAQSAPIAPITFIGLSLMAVGVILAIWAFLVLRKKSKARRNLRGPKRPKPPRGARRVVSQAGQGPITSRRQARGLSFAGILVPILLLGGCTPNYVNPIVSPSPADPLGVLTPVVTKDQVAKILGEITSVVDKADQDLDRESIEARVSGPALIARRAEYNILRRVENPTPPQPILAEPIQLLLPAATDTWPRSVMVVTGQDTLQMLVLRQDSARDPFKLYQYMNLLPGTQFPEVAAETVGANLVKADSKFLLMPPGDLATAVGSLLNEGPNSPWSVLVDGNNQYISDVSSVQQGLVETLSNANLTFDHRPSASDMVLLASGDGGALVAMYMIDTYTIIPKQPGDAVAITGDEAILLGTGGSATGIETRYGAMLLFHVPATGSQSRVTLLGATQQLLSSESLGTR